MIRKLLLFTFGAVLLLVLAFAGVSAYYALAYSPVYVQRLLLWRDSDVGDLNRFPARPIAESAVPHPLGNAPAEVQARAQALLQELLASDDLEAVLQSTGTQDLIILQGDQVVYEAYASGSSRATPVTSFSVAKSFVSTLVGIAIDEGYLGSVGDPITAYLPELADRDPAFAEITIEHLLRMSSGIHYAEFPFFHGDDALTYYYPDLRKLALQRTRLDGPPGETWLYNNYHPLLLGLVLERATGQSVADYLEEKIWQPMGAEYPASWSLDSEATGFEKMESGINARALDFARFGRLVLAGGQAGERQVIPADWLQAATQEDLSIDRAAYFPEYFLEEPELYYRYLWWGFRRAEGPDDFAALGKHGQVIYLSPAANLVLVRNGSSGDLPEYGTWSRLFYEFASRW
jgi:CubicO group peptidase (beta-lactamase class C family)